MKSLDEFKADSSSEKDNLEEIYAENNIEIDEGNEFEVEENENMQNEDLNNENDNEQEDFDLEEAINKNIKKQLEKLKEEKEISPREHTQKESEEIKKELTDLKDLKEKKEELLLIRDEQGFFLFKSLSKNFFI